MFFWNLLAFSMIQGMLVIWSLVPLPFLNPACTSGSSLFLYCWSLAWRILSINFPACEMSAIVSQLEHSLAFPFLGIGMKTDLSQPYGHCWVFQICWLIECSTSTASSFKIWNCSAGIPSPLLALFIVMLPTWLDFTLQDVCPWFKSIYLISKYMWFLNYLLYEFLILILIYHLNAFFSAITFFFLILSFNFIEAFNS